MDEVTDLIVSIELHRKQIEQESGLEASRNYALRRLQQALLQEQQASQVHCASPARAAIAEALATEIKRVGALARTANSRPNPKGQQSPRPQRHDASHGAARSRGRRTMGRNSGR